MRIHLNHPTPDHLLLDAKNASGVQYERYEKHGSRTHHAGYDIILTGESGRRTNQRHAMGDEYAAEAATWDQWGIFLAVIFEADPEALCGSAKYPAYANAEDFHVKTGGRYERCAGGEATVLSQSSPDYKITAHRWEYDFEASQPWSGSRTYYCKGHSTAKNKRAECHATRVI